MSMIKSILIFVLAGLCEIGGGYLIWLWLKENKPWWYALIGAFILILTLSFYGESICTSVAIVAVVLHVLPDRVAFLVKLVSLHVSTNLPCPPSHDAQCDEGQRFFAEEPRTCSQ